MNFNSFNYSSINSTINRFINNEDIRSNASNLFNSTINHLSSFKDDCSESLTHFFKAVIEDPSELSKAVQQAGLFGWAVGSLVTLLSIKGFTKAENKKDKIFHAFTGAVGFSILVSQIKNTFDAVNLPLAIERGMACFEAYEAHNGTCLNYDHYWDY